MRQSAKKFKLSGLLKTKRHAPSVTRSLSVGVIILDTLIPTFTVTLEWCDK